MAAGQFANFRTPAPPLTPFPHTHTHTQVHLIIIREPPNPHPPLALFKEISFFPVHFIRGRG